MNNALIPIPRELAMDMAAAAEREVQRQHDNQRAFVTFAIALAAVVALGALVLR